MRQLQRAQVLVLWLPPFIWAALIFFLSSLPGSAFPSSPFFSADKVIHLGIYAVLGYLVGRALGCYGHPRRVLTVLACCICILYGVSDEFHQSFVPDRSPSLTDIAADIVGSFLGIVTHTRKR